MINWLCGAPPARPPLSAAVKVNVTDHHASVVSITGITPICRNEDEASSGISASTHREPTIGSSSPHPRGFATALSSSSSSPASSSPIRGVGVLIHPTLVLTTHSTIPSPHCLKDAEITFCRDVASLTYVKRKFVPEIFFETNAELDLTVVSCELVAPELSYSLPLDTTKLHRRAMRKDHPIFIMGCQVRRPDDIVIMEGCITNVVRSEPLWNCTFLRFQTAGDEIWMPGTAGFDKFGSFAFIVTKPPAKLQEDMQSPSFKLRDEQSAGIRGSISSLERSQASPITARFFSHKTKQWATCVQAIKAWVEPLWKESRNEVFEGSLQPPKLEKEMRRPSTQGDALFRQKSFTPRNSILAAAQEHHGPAGSKNGNDMEDTDVAAHHPVVVSPENKAEPSPSACMEASRGSPGVAAMVPTTADQVEDRKVSDQQLDVEMQKAQPAKRSTTYKHRLTKSIVFTALAKHSTGLKKLTQRSSKSKKPEMESVCVQTTTPPDMEKEPQQEVDEDPKPVSLIRRASDGGPSEIRESGDGKKGNAGRERWSLPGELDPIVMKSSRKPPSGASKGSNVTTSSTKRGIQPQRPGGASAWIDNYYSLGRSRSDHNVKASRQSTSSAGISASKALREVPLEIDEVGYGADKDYGYDPQLTEDNPPNAQRSLSSSSSSPYTKPTISYMQRRSLAQREQVARRASQSSNVPRWS